MKISVVSSCPYGACSFYRSFGVLPKLKVETIGINDVSWQALMDTEILYFERPDNPAFLQAGQIAKDMNIKLWVDFDDNLFCVPNYNPHAHYYNRAAQSNIIKNIQQADIVTVTTPALAEEFSTFYDKKIIVIPNAHNDYNFPLKHNLSNKNIILWRGSATHRKDLLTYSRQIWDIAASSKWNWEFIGKELWYLTDGIERKNITPELNIPQYFKTIKNMQPAVYIVPLVKNKFNTAKSNCGWLEATFAGAVTLAPNMPEWQRPGITTYRNPEDFGKKLEMLMADFELRKENYEKSFNYIKQNLLLSQINKQRQQIINNLNHLNYFKK